MVEDRDAPYRPLYQEVVLRPPPRTVPWGLRAKLRVGSPFGILGWAFMAAGSIFVWVFVANSELMSLRRSSGPRAAADATVTDVSPTTMSENDSPVMKVSFEFDDHAGTHHRGASYTPGATPARGQRVRVRYAQDDPSTARVDGMRARAFSSWVGFVAVFPAIGLVFAVLAWRRGGKAIRLLRTGTVGQGTLVGRRVTNTQINEQYVVEYTFEFDVRGRTYRATARTHTGELTDDALEPLLYDPNWPANNTLLDHLPGAPKVGQQGEITSTWGAGAILAVALPAMFALVNLVAWRSHTG